MKLEITNDKYWDCECKHDYIHKKTIKKDCSGCNSNMYEQPDSIKTEVRKNHDSNHNNKRT